MKAIAIRRRKYPFPDGSIAEIIVWQLPQPRLERPHGLKYRLNYSLPDGTTAIRFDNELGKGDHVHIHGVEQPYQFESLEKLLTDFRKAIKAQGGKL